MCKLTNETIEKARAYFQAKIDAISSPNYNDLYNETHGSTGTCWYAWDNVSLEEWRDLWEEFHVEGIWPSARIEAVANGGSEPTLDELEQWRRAYCVMEAHSGEVGGVMILPFVIEHKTEAWVLLELGGGYPYDAPTIIGVFGTKEEAVASVERGGAVGGWS